MSLPALKLKSNSPFFSFPATSSGLLRGDLHDHGVDAVGLAQDHRLTATPHVRSYQGLLVPASSRSQIPSFSKNHSQRYQAGKSLGQFQLCTQNLWLWPCKVRRQLWPFWWEYILWPPLRVMEKVLYVIQCFEFRVKQTIPPNLSQNPRLSFFNMC